MGITSLRAVDLNALDKAIISPLKANLEVNFLSARVFHSIRVNWARFITSRFKAEACSVKQTSQGLCDLTTWFEARCYSEIYLS